MSKSPRSVILVYVLLAYVILQFSWWAYLIYGLNVELINTTPTPNSESDINAKLMMILGEGTVFISLLVAGALYIRNYLLREHKLAHQERNFLLATTHELNSPLAGIKLNLQTLLRPEVTPDQSKQMVLSGLKNVDRLEALIQNILMASRIDAGKFVLETTSIQLSKILNDSIAKFGPQLEDAKINVLLNSDIDVSIRGDKRAIEIILGNLISNACKYAKETRIEFSIKKSQSIIILEYRDNGPGVPGGSVDLIFNKFFRVENEETRAEKGTGLGMYLVKELALLHQGKVFARNLTPQGLGITIQFPNNE